MKEAAKAEVVSIIPLSRVRVLPALLIFFVVVSIVRTHNPFVAGSSPGLLLFTMILFATYRISPQVSPNDINYSILNAGHSEEPSFLANTLSLDP